jgi:hypothetical protein
MDSNYGTLGTALKGSSSTGGIGGTGFSGGGQHPARNACKQYNSVNRADSFLVDRIALCPLCLLLGGGGGYGGQQGSDASMRRAMDVHVRLLFASFMVMLSVSCSFRRRWW